jgi:hypothetical protein
VLQWCHSGVRVALTSVRDQEQLWGVWRQWCYSGVTVVLQLCYSRVSVVLQDHTVMIQLKSPIQLCYRVMATVLQCNGYGVTE